MAPAKVVRLPAVFVALALLAGCGPKPTAKYPESIGPCDLIPRAAAVGVLDVGQAIGPAQPKESHIIIRQVYCQWDYKQPKKGFWSALKPGPSKRQLTTKIEILTADQGAAGAAAGRFDTYADDPGTEPVNGIGHAAVWKTETFGGRRIDTVMFHRANALVTVSLNGRDCCSAQKAERDMTATNRRQLTIKAATAADHFLLSYR